MNYVPAHYIRENKAARVPRRLIVFDVQSTSDRTPTGEVQQWRCGSAAFIHWTNKGYKHDIRRAYESPEALWVDITDFCRPKQRTVLYGHNLTIKLRLAKGLLILPGLGWKLEAIRVSNQGTWSRWSRGPCSLTICDSASIFPVTVYTLGQFLESRRLAIPDGDDLTEWVTRSEKDLDIVTATMVGYFEWLRTGAAGNWQLTGAGQSWAHWRHAHYTDQVLCHSDPEAIAAERRAMFTGRAENYVWGRDASTPIYEWDWQNAYPRIARDNDVPTRLASTTGQISRSEIHSLAKRYIVLADMEVTTTRPVVPARHDGRIIWPVGTFRTTLWWPEIAALESTGATYTVERTWLYRSAPALRSWAHWVLGELWSERPTHHRWLGVLLKHWSRALIGRFSTQYQNWEPFGIDTVDRVQIGKIYDTDNDTMLDFMQVGKEIHTMTGLTESDDSCPQITSYIMSLARAKLWDVMSALPWDSVLYADTDSVVVNTEGNALLRRMVNSGRFSGLRRKGRYQGYEIYGPRAAIIGPDEKFSGIPRNPVRTGDTEWVGEVWTQFERALRTGEFDRVTIAPRRFSVRWNEHRRARSSNGTTVPYRLPEYQPATPIGRIQPVTEKEQVAAIQRGLKAKCTQDLRGNRVANHADNSGHPGRVDIVRVAMGGAPARTPVASP